MILLTRYSYTWSWAYISHRFCLMTAPPRTSTSIHAHRLNFKLRLTFVTSLIANHTLHWQQWCRAFLQAFSCGLTNACGVQIVVLLQPRFCIMFKRSMWGIDLRHCHKTPTKVQMQCFVAIAQYRAGNRTSGLECRQLTADIHRDELSLRE